MHLNTTVNVHVEGVVLQIDVLRLPEDEPISLAIASTLATGQILCLTAAPAR